MADVDVTNAVFRKAKKSGNGNDCVEVSDTYADQNVILVRDSKNPAGAVLSFSRSEWAAFLDGANNGEFDL